MRPSRRPIIIATRNSHLALKQSQSIADILQRLNPRIEVQLLAVESEGDQQTAQPLSETGGKGLFTRAIEQALLDGRADVAVHSFKDLPVKAVAGLVVVATPRRAPAHDVLIAHSARSIEDLPQGATVGTSSLRRGTQLMRVRPDLRIRPLRGNVDTRLKRILDERQFDATLLAAAGLIRGGFEAHADKPIPVDQVLPAAAQGALAIQCRADDHVSMRRCLPLNDSTTSALVHAERTVIQKLGADCTAPVAVYAEAVDAKTMRLRARVLSPDGSQCAEADETGPLKGVKTLTNLVVKLLKEQSAHELLLAGR